MIYNLSHAKPSHLKRAAVAFACTFLSAYGHGQSLDEAVTTQLSSNSGGLACTYLYAGGGNPTGSLLDICSRPTPLGASSGATGGASATPNSLPFETQQLDDKSPGYEAQSITLDSHWTLFFNGEGGHIDRKRTEREGPYESTVQRFIAGATYLYDAKLAISGMLDLSTVEGDFENGGTFKDETTGLSILAAYQYSDKISAQVSGFFQDVSSERLRVASFSDTYLGTSVNLFTGTPQADYSPTKIGLSANVDYDMSFDAWSFLPQAGLEWVASDFGTYNERDSSGLHLTFHDDRVESLQSKIGFILSRPFNLESSVFLPQFSIDWRHEFESDSRNVIVSFVEDLNSTKFSYQANEIDANFFDLNIGGVLVMQHGLQGFVNVQTLLANDVYDSMIFSAGIRKEL